MNRYTISTDIPTSSIDEFEPKKNPMDEPKSKPIFMPDFPTPKISAAGELTFDTMSDRETHTYISNKIYPDMIATAATVVDLEPKKEAAANPLP